MKILVYGAGVIGTLYAARLQDAGHHVAILARASRLANIRRHGLVLEDVLTGTRSATTVTVAERLSVAEVYDLALISVRRDQLSTILPDLAQARNIPSVLFMLNNPSGSVALAETLGSERVLLGFPGAGGSLQDEVVYYAFIAQQPTTIGEPNGKKTARLRALANAFSAGGFPTRMDNNMDAWLTSHAFFITSVCSAIYLAGGNCQDLSRDGRLLNSMIDGVREGFSVVRTLGQPVHPSSLNVLFRYVPRPLVVNYWQRFFSGPLAEFVFARHARHARAEMKMLATDCRLLLEKSGVPTPTLDTLYGAINEYAAANQH